MNVKEKIVGFFKEILNLYSIIVFFWCASLNIFFFAGIRIFAYYLMISFVKNPEFSTIFEENKYYGVGLHRKYTPTVRKDVYDSDGRNVGYIETKGKPIYYKAEQNPLDINTPNYPVFILYMYTFIFLRVLAIPLSFIAIFTKRFYISYDVPVLYCKKYENNTKRKALYTWFNIILEDKKKS